MALDQKSSMADSAVRIDPQQSDGCCGNVRLADQHAVAPVEMFAPDINSWIEQSRQFASIRSVRRNIASFETVAQRARPTEVFWCRKSVVLLSPDMIDFVRQLRA